MHEVAQAHSTETYEKIIWKTNAQNPRVEGSVGR